MRYALRQLRQPREFRVPRPFLSSGQTGWVAAALTQTAAAEEDLVAQLRAVQAEFAQLLAEPAPATAPPPGPRPPGPRRRDGDPDTDTDTDPTALLAAAAGIWRTQRKLERRGDTLSAADLRQLRRFVQGSRDALAGDGLEMQDHDGEPFDPGQSLDVLLFQDEPELTREVVLETVRPTVYFRGERIQMGQVIVGRPVPGRTRDI